MTAGGLPVGLEIDGPVGSDVKLLGLGLSIEAILGSAPPPEDLVVVIPGRAKREPRNP